MKLTNKPKSNKLNCSLKTFKLLIDSQVGRKLLCEIYRSVNGGGAKIGLSFAVGAYTGGCVAVFSFSFSPSGRSARDA